MSDISIEPSLPEGFQRVEVDDIYKQLPQGFQPVQIPDMDKRVTELQVALDGMPDDERTRAYNALLIGDLLDREPAEAYEDHDAYASEWAGKDENPQGLFKRLFSTFKAGFVPGLMRKLVLRQIRGDASPELEEQIAGFENQMPTDQEMASGLPKIMAEGNKVKSVAALSLLLGGIYGRGLTEETRGGLGKQLFEASLLSAANILPMALQSQVEGLKQAILTAGPLALGGLLAGPQAAPVTIPLVMAGLKWGHRAGAMQFIGEVETAMSYRRMISEGIDPSVAGPVSVGVGVINAPIEYLQYSALLKPFAKYFQSHIWRNAASQATQKAVASGVLTRIAKGLMGGVARTAQESVEEGVQEAVAGIGREVAVEISNQVKGTEIEHEWNRIFPDMLQAMTHAALGFAVLQVPGTMLSMYQAVAQKAPGKPGPGARVETVPIEEIDKKYTKAIKTVDGRVHTDPNATTHEEIAEFQRIDPATVTQAGRVIQGRYLDEGDYYAWIQKGRKTEDLPPMAKEYFTQRIRETAPQVTEEQAEAIATLVEMRAESEGLSLEEYTQKYFAPEIVTRQPVIKTEEILLQEIRKSPDFQRWAEGTDIVEDIETYEFESGQDVTVRAYHGQPAAYRTFPVSPEEDAIIGQKLAEYHKRVEPIWEEYKRTTDPIFKDENYYNDPKKLAIVRVAVQKRTTAEVAIEKEIGEIPSRYHTEWLGVQLEGGMFDPSRSQDIGMHFGTQRQANKFAGERGAVFPVYLRIRNLIRIPDIFSRPEMAEAAVGYLINMRAIKENRIDNVLWKARVLDEYAASLADVRDLGTSKKNETFWKYVRNSIKKDVEGFVYRNAVEGGGDSFVVFHPEQIKSVYNKGTFDATDPRILFQADLLYQAERGAVSFAEQGKALIHATEASDFSTFVHEMGHVWRRQLGGEGLRTIEEWAGVKEGTWTRDAEEKFANGLEQYLREEAGAETFSEKLKVVFEQFKEWLKNIYNRFAKMHMPDEVRRVYEGLLLSPEEQDRRLATKPFTEEDTPRAALQETLREIHSKQMTYVGGLFNKAQQGSIQRTVRYGLNDRAYKYWMKLMNANPAKYRKIFAMLEGDYDNRAFWEEQGYTVAQPGETYGADRAEADVEEPGGATLSAIEDRVELGAEENSATLTPHTAAKKAQDGGRRIIDELTDAYGKLKEQWFRVRDEALLRNDVEKRRLQKQIKTLLNIKRYDEDAKLLDAAIHFYIDSKRNPEHVAQFYEIVNAKPEEAEAQIREWLTAEEELLPKFTDREISTIYERLLKLKALVDRSQSLSTEEVALAEQIEQTYQEFGKKALDADVIHNVLEHYAGRVWDRRGKEVAPILRRFGTTTHHAKRRVFDTIIEGYVFGHRLKVHGATNNLHIIRRELTKTMADKAFLKAMLVVKDVDGNSLLTTRETEGYKEVKHPNFKTWRYAGQAEPGKVYGKNVLVTDEGALLERQTIYAPEKQAKNLNNMLYVPEMHPAVKGIAKYNAIFKSWILQSSFFHHCAFMRSYYLGTNHKNWKEMNVFRAYKDGIAAVEALQSEIVIGVRNGLTLGVQQEWEEALLEEDTILEPLLEKIKPAHQVAEWLREFRRRHVDFLFGTFGAGLKAKAFLIEYRNQLKARPHEDVNVIAREVADLINDDFGGLHLQRMGRSKSVQTVMKLFLLAPDWTESNVRTMIKMFGLSTDQGPVTKAQRKIFQRFWMMALLKGMGATVILNFMTAGGDPDRFLKNYEIMWRETIRKGGSLRIFDVDVTSIYRALGGKSSRRKYFTLIGHFRDPIKFMVKPVQSLRHKGSVLFGMLIEAMTQRDWAGRRFTTFRELVRAGKTVDWHPDTAQVDYEWLPSYIISQLIGVTPVQVQNLISWLNGELEAFEAIGNSMGLGVRTTY